MLPERAFIRGFDGRIQPQGGGKGGGGSAPAPDPSIGAAQLRLTELAEAQYKDFKEEVWPEMLKQSAHQQEQADEWQKQQMDLADKNSGIADEYYARMKEKFYPIQDKMVQEATDYNTEGNFQMMANRALGDTNAQNELARKNQSMQMAQFGIDPTSGAYTGANQAINTMGAANSAAASNRAYTAARELGWNLGMITSGLGAGLPGQQVASSGVAMNAGNGGMATGQMAMGNYGALGSSMNQAYGGAMQGYGQSGSLGAQSYNTQVNAWNAQQASNAQSSSGWGSAIGGLVGAGMSGGALGFGGSAIGMGMKKAFG
jgi:L-rhamnose mutarotase